MEQDCRKDGRSRGRQLIQVFTKQNTLILQSKDSDFSQAEAQGCLDALQSTTVRFGICIVNLTNIQTIEADALRALAQLSNPLNTLGARLIILATQKIADQIEQNKLSGQLPCFVGVHGWLSDIEAQRDKAPVKIEDVLDTVFEATRDLFSVYTKGKYQNLTKIKTEANLEPLIDIAGVGTFDIDGRVGTLVLGFQKDSYLKLISAILGKPYTSLAPPNDSWASEFINTVLSKVMVRFKNQGHSANAALPFLFVGKSIASLFMDQKHNGILFYNCEADFGQFVMKIALGNPR